MRTRLSVCARKTWYRLAEDAALVAARGDLALRAYRCDRCHQFHLTSRIKGKWVSPAGKTGEAEL